MWRRDTIPARFRSAARLAHRVLLFPTLDFLLPSRCFACQAPLGRWQHLGACTRCWSLLEPLRPPCCARCGLPAPSGSDLQGPSRGLCGRCLTTTSHLDGVRAAVVYETVARKFLLRAKIGRRRELLLPMASRLAAAVRAAALHEGCQSLAPVPSHRLTDLRRGFSPSLELARHLSKILCIPMSPGLLFRRLGPGRAAKRLSATRRWETTSRQFRLRRQPGVTRLLLVDDVMTTGASAETCAGLLKEGGAKVVRLAVWARRGTK